ncbi:hypothetical protein [Bradyrhizobium sp. SSUT77]|uniref:hypothetical protein n=1 Tax=Bradyrhizobium sp. SSUT77 TaxID=3040603 RepID=UPI002448750E|nr:hypothetical protein [Bradyrhizobium sp. SSUT77]MDH2340977.1 hypothetical protein [Bradyrhizobium sp. SSUT77]
MDPVDPICKGDGHLRKDQTAATEAAGGRRGPFYSGDDAAAKAEVRKLIEDTGFFPVDLGSLDVGGRLASLPFGALAAHNFIKV